MRGCQKRMIQIKNMSGGIFDEAYFILREDAGICGHSESDMVQEASRIIEENQITIRQKPRFYKKRWFPFASGAAATAALFGLAKLLF